MWNDLGLLVLRLSLGGMLMIGHGWGKLKGFTGMMHQFPDPIGLGSTVSLTLVVFAEFFCAAAVILGLLTRLSAIPIFIAMVVAGLVFHEADPWQKKELALAFASSALVLTIMGGGKFSLDHALRLTRR